MVSSIVCKLTELQMNHIPTCNVCELRPKKKKLCSGIPTDPNFSPYPKNVEFFLMIFFV